MSKVDDVELSYNSGIKIVPDSVEPIEEWPDETKEEMVSPKKEKVSEEYVKKALFDEPEQVKKKTVTKKAEKREIKQKKRKPERKKETKPSKKSKRKKHHLIIILIAIIAVLFVISQDKPTIEKSNIIVSVNGEDITNTQIDTLYASVPPQLQQVFTKELLVEQLIDEKLLLEDAKKKGYTVDEELINATLDDVLGEQGMSRETYKLSIEQQGQTWDAVMERLRKEMIINELISKEIFTEIQVTDEELEKYYTNNKQQFGHPEQVNASHILICFKGATSCTHERTEEEAKVLTASLLNRVKKGENINKLAVEYSDDSSAQFNQGNLGFFGKGQMVPEFETLVFNMQEGETDFTKTTFGYHVITLHEHREEAVQPLEDIREQLRAQLTQDRERQAFELYITQLRSNADIEWIQKKGPDAEISIN